ncbi:uncharacterized protein LOC107366269 [Tetranychus urticae]|uniref:RING-CH-type domain-containing protein n=1 Tax=Tetranychus urticae TaxID=32264 RepID=T1KPZ4_TETUR|nr:uncharacterized protein LOC107366269 [Tetranychus urticae]
MTETVSKPEPQNICRICLTTSSNDCPLIQPCNCVGELAYCHSSCLSKWISATKILNCDICQFKFIISIEHRSFIEWLSSDEDELQQFCIGSFTFLLTFYLIILGEVTTSMTKDTGSMVSYLFVISMTATFEFGFLIWIAFFSFLEANRFTKWRDQHIKIKISSNSNRSPFRNSSRSLSKDFGSFSINSLTLVQKKADLPPFIEYPVAKHQERTSETNADWDFNRISQFSDSSESNGSRKVQNLSDKNSSINFSSQDSQSSSFSERSFSKIAELKAAPVIILSEDKAHSNGSGLLLSRKRKVPDCCGLLATGGVHKVPSHSKQP